MDKYFVASHGKEAADICHSGVVVCAGVGRSRLGHLRERGGGGCEHGEQLSIGRIAVREEVEAEPAGTPDGQVRGVPADGIAHMREGRADVPGQITGPNGPPVVLD
jgi:hypothetical protein